MFVFQTHKSIAQTPVGFDASKLTIAVPDFVRNDLHTTLRSFDNIMDNALSNTRRKNPDAYVENPKAFSLTAELNERQKRLASEWYPVLVNDSVYVNGLKKAFCEESKLVKPENFEEFVKKHTQLVTLVLVQHAENLKDKIAEIHFMGEMVGVCSAVSCITFNIMEEVRKIAPDLFGEVRTKPTEPQGRLVEISPFAALSPGYDSRKFANLFGGEALQSLTKNVMPTMYNAYLRQFESQSQNHFFASSGEVPNESQRDDTRRRQMERVQGDVEKEKERAKRMAKDDDRAYG